MKLANKLTFNDYRVHCRQQLYCWCSGFLLGVVIIGLAVVLYACNGKPQPPAVPNSTDPKWVFQSKPASKAALVFVHGIFGDTLGTWTNKNGTSFFDLIRNDPKLGGVVDIFAFGFTSNMFQSGSLDIQEAANKLYDRLKYHGLNDYPAVVFVAHSMGGLVVLRELLTHREMLERVPVMVFFATPQEGAQITVIAKEVAHNSALEQMLPADQNGYLRTMSDEWGSLDKAKRPTIRCAYEKKPTVGSLVVVPWASATRFCEGTPTAISEDHLGIVKPDRPEHDSVVVLANALNEFVVGKQFAAKLETPDFVKTGIDMTFTIADPFAKQPARLVNAGRIKLRYTLAEFSDPSLYVWPADTPRDLPGGTTEQLQFALSFRAKASEYRFVLKSDVSADQPVIVRVANQQALAAQREKLAKDFSDSLKVVVSDPSQTINWNTAPTDDPQAQEAIVRVARETVARTNPNLAEVGQWVIAAEVLNAVNWPNLAVRALKNAERISPKSVNTTSVQRLAALTAAQSGKTDIFATTKTPVISDAELVVDSANPLTTSRAASSSMELASQLQRFPPLKSFGLSLKGDVQLAQGNKKAAREAFTESAAILPSPSIARRLPLTTSGAMVMDPKLQSKKLLDPDMTRGSEITRKALTDRALVEKR